MTSLKQIEANRRNALKSTGPRTETGKQRSRRNATRHGLTAETVIEPLENPEDYKAFEMSITAEFDAQTAVERSSSCVWPACCGGFAVPRPLKLAYSKYLSRTKNGRGTATPGT